MTTEQIIEMQRRFGGVAPDGIWGTKSKTALREYLHSLMPRPNPWPSTDEASLWAFYGKPGDEAQLINIDVVDFGMKQNGHVVTRVRVHHKCAESLLEILRELKTVRPDILEKFNGVYNYRSVHSGNTWSLHARGAAIDLDYEDNGNFAPWPTNASMPLEVMEVFSRYGWLCSAAEWGRDAMHFQATSF